jgi:acetyltransferase-like isoleucine patch superfamily enzyme
MSVFRDRLRSARAAWRRAARRLGSLALQARLRRAGCTMASAPETQRFAPLIVNQGTIALGSCVKFWGRQFRVELHAGPGGRLEIGDETLINQGTTIASHRSVRIGAHCLIGEFVAIHDSGFHAVAPGEQVNVAPVHIGDNVWIGHRAVILPGVSIGDHAVIGAGSVVTSSVPPRQVAAGCPARSLRAIACEDAWVRA